MIGELYEHALAGWARPEIEHADGSRKPLPVDGWLRESPGDKSILDRCEGPTLDIGSGPGRLTVALAERGIPALGIDITPYAVDLARSSGALVMLRDVFDRVPGTRSNTSRSMTSAPEDRARSTAYGVMSMPSAGMPRSARATVSRPGPEPMSSVGPSQRSRIDLSPGLSRSQPSTGSGLRLPSACSISGLAQPASACS